MDLTLLDLYCGMGGASIGFYREGFECQGLDIIDVGYPYHWMKMDVHDYKGKKGSCSAVWASPPCTEYSPMTQLSHFKGQRGPPDPDGPKGIPLVKEAIRIIKEIEPRYWIIENVYASLPYLKPLLGKPRVKAKPFMLWGNFPDVLWPDMEKDKYKNKLFHQEARYVAKKNKSIVPQDFPCDPLRSWKRAKIPVWVAQTIAKACKEKMQMLEPQLLAWVRTGHQSDTRFSVQ
jgi:hypothetical protein